MYITYEIESLDYGIFRDAIFIPDEYVVTDAEIETMKAQRYMAWLNQIIAMQSGAVVSSDAE